MFQHIRPQELADRQKAGQKVYLLDVRQPAENMMAALPGSVLVPLNQLPTRLAEIQPEPGQPVIVYCHHGVRSQMAAEFLARNGFNDVYSLVGGIDAWSMEIDPAIPRYR